MKHRLMAFVGPAGVGKSTAGRVLEYHGYKRHRFAEPLKAMLRALGLTYEQVDGTEKEKPCRWLGGLTPRVVMQKLGTDWGRDMISPSLWVDAWVASLPNGLVYVDDCRFPNEADVVRRWGGTLIRIASPGFEYAANHESEAHDLAADYTIEVARGAIEELQNRVLDIVLG